MNELRDTVDCNIYTFGNTSVPTAVMYAALVGTVLLLIGVYVLLNYTKSKKAAKGS